MDRFVILKGGKKLGGFHFGEFPYNIKNVFKDGFFREEKSLCISKKWFKISKTSYNLYLTEKEAMDKIQFFKQTIKKDDRILPGDMQKALKICDSLKIVLDDGKLN